MFYRVFVRKTTGTHAIAVLRAHSKHDSRLGQNLQGPDSKRYVHEHKKIQRNSVRFDQDEILSSDTVR